MVHRHLKKLWQIVCKSSKPASLGIRREKEESVMKLIMAVVQDKDSALLSDELVEANIRATKLSSSGGFLRAGNTTFMIGVEDGQVEEVLNLIKVNCESREQFMTTPVNMDT